MAVPARAGDGAGAGARRSATNWSVQCCRSTPVTAASAGVKSETRQAPHQQALHTKTGGCAGKALSFRMLVLTLLVHARSTTSKATLTSRLRVWHMRGCIQIRGLQSSVVLMTHHVHTQAALSAEDKHTGKADERAEWQHGRRQGSEADRAQQRRIPLLHAHRPPRQQQIQ